MFFTMGNYSHYLCSLKATRPDSFYQNIVTSLNCGLDQTRVGDCWKSGKTNQEVLVSVILFLCTFERSAFNTDNEASLTEDRNMDLDGVRLYFSV